MSEKQLKVDFSVVSCAGLMALTAVTGLILVSSKASAEDSATTTASVTVPVACSMAGHTDTAHNASLIPGTYSGASGSQYENGIGKTTLTTFCNDNNGFSIYAVGYTGDTLEGGNHTKLVGTSTSNNATISTKVYEPSDTASNWSMKVTKVDDSTKSYNPQNMTIANSFNNWHIVPDTYTKVAEYHATTGSSTTDTTLGAKVETTYATYISTTQPADTYTGKVKYTMVHPYNEEPLAPQPATSGRINYFANASDAVGTMGCQTISDYAKDWSQCVNGTDYSSYCYNSDYSNIISSLPSTNNAPITLLASNFSREGYGFAGWSDKFDYATNASAKFYGPQETITLTPSDYQSPNKGLSLYAVWVKSEGNLQDTDKVTALCGTNGVGGSLTTAPTNGTANLSSVSALTDQRDNNTYAIARLADGNCWMIENLRLESTNSDNTTGALAQGYGTSTTYGNFGGLADAESTGFTSTYSANSLYSNDGSNNTINIGASDYPAFRMPRYNNWNNQSTSANRPQNPTTNDTTNSTTNAGMYSYGNYYTWHAAIADLTYYDTDNNSITGTSLCPAGWHLPKGGNNQNTANNEFLAFSEALIGTKPANYDSQTFPYYTGTPEGSNASNKLRAYPNNFLYSGVFIASSAYDRGSYGYYWSSTAYVSGNSYYLDLYSSGVFPGTYSSNKNDGQSIRCTVGS